MTRTKSLALAFYLGAALAGAAIGISVDRLVVQSQTRWWDQTVMRRRTFDRLGLTVAQRDSATRIYDDRNHRQDSILAPLRPALDSVSGEARQRIAKLLTPQQQTIYDQMQRERQQAQRQEKK
jgi:hypothetical protein